MRRIGRVVRPVGVPIATAAARMIDDTVRAGDPRPGPEEMLHHAHQSVTRHMGCENLGLVDDTPHPIDPLHTDAVTELANGFLLGSGPFSVASQRIGDGFAYLVDRRSGDHAIEDRVAAFPNLHCRIGQLGCGFTHGDRLSVHATS